MKYISTYSHNTRLPSGPYCHIQKPAFIAIALHADWIFMGLLSMFNLKIWNGIGKIYVPLASYIEEKI
jgi:hypothetical protein